MAYQRLGLNSATGVLTEIARLADEGHSRVCGVALVRAGRFAGDALNVMASVGDGERAAADRADERDVDVLVMRFELSRVGSWLAPGKDDDCEDHVGGQGIWEGG